MALSKQMVETLRDNYSYQNGITRDGRTVRALQNRGLIKNVRKPEDKRTPWKWKYTASGKDIAYALFATRKRDLHHLTK